MSARTPDEGRYSKVTRRMWNDEGFRALSEAPPNAQTLWTRLLTGPELGPIPGLFAARLPGLADALRWPADATEEKWNEIAAQGMAKADWRAGLVWVPNAFFHNEPESPNVVLGWRLALRELPECALKREAIAALKGYLEDKGKAWAVAFREAFGEAFAKATGKGGAKACAKPSVKDPPHPSDNQEQEQDSGAGDLPPPPRTRARGERPRPRPALLARRLAVRDYEPLQDHVVYAEELGIYPAGYERALLAFRDFFGGKPHDEPYLDDRLCGFIEQEAKPKETTKYQRGARGPVQGGPPGYDPAAKARANAEREEAERKAAGGVS